MVADALSRKTELAAISSVRSEFQGAIKDGMLRDPKAKKIMELAAQGQTKRFWVEDGFLLTTGRRIYQSLGSSGGVLSKKATILRGLGIRDRREGGH